VSGSLVVTPTVVIPESELRWRFSRSSGPGGQSVNTSDSRVELRFDVVNSAALGPVLRRRALDRLAGRLADGVLTVAASEHRSQLRNREAALTRLAALVRAAVAPPPRARRATAPTRRAREERLGAKRRRAEIKRARQASLRDRYSD
jgi:ribosome-associated protein